MTIEILELEEMDLRGGVLIDGFPTVGLVSSIVANYIISKRGLRLAGLVDSPDFPSVAVILGSEVLTPMRIYGGRVGDRPMAVLVSDFSPPPPLVRPVGGRILEWAREKGVDLIVSPEGVVSASEEVRVYGVASTDRVRGILKAYSDKVQSFGEGLISGMAGYLLLEGRKRGLDVMVLLADANPNLPDARAAARILEVLNLMLNMGIELEPLLKEAQAIEAKLSEIKKMAERVKKDKYRVSIYG
ncbi:MAG TPA: proteasome assembly chaperone family protein [Aciduliprofundum sp.]|nr:proteasome assembly chaperone family protein [Thermoplasmata archaeon]HDJ27472.1 proteasome assembly chaperone family protein [Aciduliprofundum sp.]